MAAAVCLGAVSSASAQSGSDLLSLGDVLYAAGDPEGREEDVFGSLQDLAFAPDGRLAVLDNLTPALKVYSPTGTLIGVVGGEGQGPGEWAWPSAVDWISADRLAVLSQGHRRLHLYSVSDGGVEHERDVTLPLVARDFCAMDGTVFLLGLDDGRTVHRVSLGGEPLVSFGPVPTLSAELLGEWEREVTQWTVDGRILCDDGRDVVVTIPFNLPLVRAYEPEGALRWSAELADYRQSRWAPLPGRRGARVALDPETNTAHSMRSAFFLDSTRLVIQLIEWSAGDDLGELEPETRVLALEDGLEDSGSVVLPRVAAVTADRAVLLHEALYPRITVRERARRRHRGRLTRPPPEARGRRRGADKTSATLRRLLHHLTEHGPCRP